MNKYEIHFNDGMVLEMTAPNIQTATQKAIEEHPISYVIKSLEL